MVTLVCSEGWGVWRAERCGGGGGMGEPRLPQAFYIAGAGRLSGTDGEPGEDDDWIPAAASGSDQGFSSEEGDSDCDSGSGGDGGLDGRRRRKRGRKGGMTRSSPSSSPSSRSKGQLRRARPVAPAPAAAAAATTADGRSLDLAPPCSPPRHVTHSPRRMTERQRLRALHMESCTVFAARAPPCYPDLVPGPEVALVADPAPGNRGLLPWILPALAGGGALGGFTGALAAGLAAWMARWAVARWDLVQVWQGPRGGERQLPDLQAFTVAFRRLLAAAEDLRATAEGLLQRLAALRTRGLGLSLCYRSPPPPILRLEANAAGQQPGLAFRHLRHWVLAALRRQQLLCARWPAPAEPMRAGAPPEPVPPEPVLLADLGQALAEWEGQLRAVLATSLELWYASPSRALAAAGQDREVITAAVGRLAEALEDEAAALRVAANREASA